MGYIHFSIFFSLYVWLWISHADFAELFKVCLLCESGIELHTRKDYIKGGVQLYYAYATAFKHRAILRIVFCQIFRE